MYEEIKILNEIIKDLEDLSEDFIQNYLCIECEEFLDLIWIEKKLEKYKKIREGLK